MWSELITTRKTLRSFLTVILGLLVTGEPIVIRLVGVQLGWAMCRPGPDQSWAPHVRSPPYPPMQAHLPLHPDPPCRRPPSPRQRLCWIYDPALLDRRQAWLSQLSMLEHWLEKLKRLAWILDWTISLPPSSCSMSGRRLSAGPKSSSVMALRTSEAVIDFPDLARA